MKHLHLTTGFILFLFTVTSSLGQVSIIPGTSWFGRFDVSEKMVQVEEANAGIAIAMARLDDKEMDHFPPQKSAKTKRFRYSSSVGGGPLFMDGFYDNYRSGVQLHLGFQTAYNFRKLKRLSLETGLEGYLGRIGYYDFAGGGSSGVNNGRPLDKSKQNVHHLRTVDVPLRVKYNAFDFMGVVVGVRGSYLADGYVDLPGSDQKSRYLNYTKIVPVGEAGLFFPVGKRLVITANAVKSLKERFFDEYYIDSEGKKVGVGTYADYGFMLRMSYLWNP